MQANFDEFVFCERAWWLSRQGYTVSPRAEADRAAGVAFHEQRARAARAAPRETHSGGRLSLPLPRLRFGWRSGRHAN